jgi:hypothetical protein
MDRARERSDPVNARDPAPLLAADANQLPARGPQRAHAVIAEPCLERERRGPEQQLDFARIVHVAVEIADVAIYITAFRKPVV